MSLWWVFAFYALERLCELRLAARNRRVIITRGGREFFAETYRELVLLHTLFFAALLAESYPWRVPLDLLTLFCLAALALLMALRYWCIASLGAHWNTRIVVLPGAAAVRRGPYRFLRHPNYLVVVLEFALLPLLCRALVTLIVFSLANLLVLRRRIGFEERALGECTDWDRGG